MLQMDDASVYWIDEQKFIHKSIPASEPTSR